MSDKRLKRFNKQFSIFSNNPAYEKIKTLYINDVLKNVTSVEKYFNKIKLTKKNQLYKSSIKFVNEIDTKYKTYNKNVLTQNIKNQRLVTIDETNIFQYGMWIHEKEFLELQKTAPNAYYVQTVKFLNKNHQPINAFQTVILKTYKKLIGKTKKDFWENIRNSMTTAEYEWKIELWTTPIEEDLDYKKIYRKGNYATIETVAYKNIPNVKKIITNQLYQENETKTCVYDGFLNFFSNGDRKKKAIYNKLIKNKSIYGKAYTDETLNEICNFTQSTLIIKDLINGKDKIFPTKNSRYTIEFINTKYNHLDYTTNTYKDITQLDTREEYEKIKKSSKFYIETMGKLITLDKTYKIKDDEFKIIYNEWKEKINYNSLLINDTNDALKLINEYNNSSHCFFNDFEIKNKLYDELDVEKAYYNYSNTEKNPDYHGVPSGKFVNFKCEDDFTIEIFNKQLKNKLIGFYQVIITKINNHLKLYEKLGISENKMYVFTSVQINTFKDDLEFKFLNLSISPSVHIPFTENFKTKNEGLAYYCKAYGLLMVSSNYISTTIKPLVCDINYYSIIQDENIKIYEYDGLIKIKNINNVVKTGIHIYYYIHSYTKNLIFQQLKEVDINDVFGVKIDSIVIKKNVKINKILPCFHQQFKECKIEKMLIRTESINDFLDFTMQGVEGYKKDELDGHDVYSDGNGYFKPLFTESFERINFKSSFLPNNEMIINNVVFMSGKGGSGKSHSILENNNSVCMVSACWNLTQAKKEKYSYLHPLSINKITGKTGDKKSEKIKVNDDIIFLDEATMWNKQDLIQVINDYQNHFVFIAGDVDFNGRFYQCTLQQEVIIPSEINCQFVTYIKNYRFDEELNRLLDGLRLCKSKEARKEYVYTYFKSCIQKKENIIFDDKTIGISDLNDTKNDDELTNYFLSKGATKQYYIKNTIFNKGQYKGARLEKIPDHNNYECKLFKTIHSFQGLDLNDDEKIVISNKRNFDTNLYYTAFSRARRLNQIILLE